MDPNANMSEQIRIKARRAAKQPLPGDSARLRELQTALRGWLASGGFAPTVQL